MDGQVVLVWIVLGLAACYLARESWRAWFAQGKSCAGGCGCGKQATDVRPRLVHEADLLERLRNRRGR